MQLRRAIMPLMVAAMMLVSMGVANATLQMTLTSGAATSGPVSTNSCPGPSCVVTFVGAVGNWLVNVSTGSGLGVIPGVSLDLNSIDSSTTGSSTPLVITLVESGLTLAPGYSGMYNGNGSYSSVQMQAFDGTSLGSIPNLIGSTGLITNPTPGTPVALDGSLSGSTTPGDTALAIVLTFNSPGPGGGSGDAFLTGVPEPASVLMLGGILLVVGGALRRKVRQ